MSMKLFLFVATIDSKPFDVFVSAEKIDDVPALAAKYFDRQPDQFGCVRVYEVPRTSDRVEPHPWHQLYSEFFAPFDNHWRHLR